MQTLKLEDFGNVVLEGTTPNDVDNYFWYCNEETFRVCLLSSESRKTSQNNRILIPNQCKK